MTSKDWSGNVNSVWKTLGASNHTENEREADDYYATDPIAIDKLLEVENRAVLFGSAPAAADIFPRGSRSAATTFSTATSRTGGTQSSI